ncbi:MAG: redoxin domain-containing protein [Symploca sp. SIO2D2]|nr:redoxin domain-containing protein [Symploca sp. SIO2D2]
MKKTRFLTAALLLTPLLFAKVETWTTVTGDSIKAEIVGFHGPLVFFEKGKKRNTVNVPYVYLTDDCKARAVSWLEGYLEENQDQTTVAQSDAKITDLLEENLVTLQDGKLVPFEFASDVEPEYYVFYYSARWCGPCRRFTPKLVAFYNAMKMAGYDNFEVVFVSSDNGAGEMKRYIEEDKMPWPALKIGKRGMPTIRKMKGNGIPCLAVTDREGRILAHSYNGDEYLGPSEPKDLLRSFVTVSKSRMEKFAQPKAK